MSKILLYRIRAERMHPEKFVEMGERLGMENEPIETEEAIAIKGRSSAIVYAQPGAKFAGLLFYTDQARGAAEAVDKLFPAERAERWAHEFLRGFDLVPREAKDEGIALAFELVSHQNEAITFDGKERRASGVKTVIGSKIALNDIPVVGPRAKVRMTFKERERPILIHRGLWQDIEVYEERELVRRHDVVKVVREKLANRRKREAYYNVADVKLAYFAEEFRGGPDLLVPSYFVEVEFEDVDARKHDITDGPKQVFQIPAYR